MFYVEYIRNGETFRTEYPDTPEWRQSANLMMAYHIAVGERPKIIG